MIGTITLHHNANYGANLQAYALVKYLDSLVEDEVCLIDYQNERIRNLYRVAPFDLCDEGISFSMTACKRFVKMCLNPQGTLIRDRKFYVFRKTNIPMTKTVKCSKEIKAIGCSHLLVGSDQVWNDWITGDQKNRVFYGNVKCENNVVASYAPSLGNSKFSPAEDSAVSEFIQNFDFLSVREQELMGLLKDRYAGTIEVVCDPVFLLRREEWEKLCSTPEKQESYIFVYFLERNPVLFEITKKVAENLGMSVKCFSDGRKYTQTPWGYDRSAGPEDFVKGIRDAAFVITNSFHGTVFSMLFHKQFLTIPDTKRGIRMVELLRKHGLIDRLCINTEDYSVEKLYRQIDYAEIDRLIEEERSLSREYLLRVLHSKSINRI